MSTTQDPKKPAKPKAARKRAVRKTAARKAPTGKKQVEKPVSVLIVGAGFAGLGMAIRLKQAGIEDFIILERGNAVGAPGRITSIRALPVIFPRTCIPIPSHRIPTGHAIFPATKKFSIMSIIWWPSLAWKNISALSRTWRSCVLTKAGMDRHHGQENHRRAAVMARGQLQLPGHYRYRGLPGQEDSQRPLGS